MPVRITTLWLVSLALLVGLLNSTATADEIPYGPPEPQPPYFLRPYPQRSFRGYYLHRVAQCWRSPSVEFVPTFEIDVTPSYKIDRFTCPYVYPTAGYPRSELQRPAPSE